MRHNRYSLVKNIWMWNVNEFFDTIVWCLWYVRTVCGWNHLSKKQWSILYSKLLFEMSNYFFGHTVKNKMSNFHNKFFVHMRLNIYLHFYTFFYELVGLALICVNNSYVWLVCHLQFKLGDTILFFTEMIFFYIYSFSRQFRLSRAVFNLLKIIVSL